MAKKQVDYEEASREHKKLVRRLVSPKVTTADWEKFYSTIREIVNKRHGEELRDKAYLSVDDFMRGELTSFLCEDNYSRLLQFLNLKSENSEHHHFGGKWFAKTLQSAVKKACIRRPGEISGETPLPGGKDDEEDGRTIMDSISSDMAFKSMGDVPVSLHKLLRRVGGAAFTRLIAKFWKKKPLVTYAVLMDAQLNFPYRKIAALLGREDAVRDKKDEIAVAGNVRDWRRTLKKNALEKEVVALFPFVGKMSDRELRELLPEMRERWDSKAFGADGKAEPDVVAQLGAALETLYFWGGRRSRGDRPTDAMREDNAPYNGERIRRVGDNAPYQARSPGDAAASARRPYQWQLELKMPFEVTDKALIRGVLSDGSGGVPKGALFCCGKMRKVRTNGHFEFPVDEFRGAARSSEMYFIDENGVRSDGSPFVPQSDDVEYRPTPELLSKWASAKMAESDPVEMAADLLDDFGMVFTQLILSRDALRILPFKQFGVPLIEWIEIPMPMPHCIPGLPLGLGRVRELMKSWTPKKKWREYNEAWVLCNSCMDVDPDSPLSQNGFILPLEWMYNPDGAEISCKLLPEHLAALSRRVTARMVGVESLVGGIAEERTLPYQLRPSSRFFNERVDFSAKGLFGEKEEDMASATVALAVALRYALRRSPYGGWPYSSIGYDFANDRAQGVGGIAKKIALRREKCPDSKCLFIAADQNGVPEGECCENDVRRIKSLTLPEIADEVAYSHLECIKPTRPAEFKVVPERLLSRRNNIVTNAPGRDGLFSLANKKDTLLSRGSFVVLFGGPGTGKSVLMGLLKKRCEDVHKAFGYVCHAGCANNGMEFVKSLAYDIACQCGDEAGIGEILTSGKGECLKSMYRAFVVEPLRRLVELHRYETYYVLVDGIDEDSSGDILNLLLDKELRLPPRVAVVVSSRRIVQDAARLTAAATGVIDLDEQGTDLARDVRMDVCTYIDRWRLTNEAVYNRLLDANVDSEAVKETILAHDRSFLYAEFVLNGIAEGRYSIKELKDLETGLPDDLTGCFYDAFKARFPSSEEYGRVKPLLRMLVRKGRVGVAEAGRKAVVGDETLGAVLKALRGYAVESNGEISLSSEVLRAWLKDAAHNAEFGV